MAFTLAQINALVSAGYNPEEILAVNGPVEQVEKPVETVENPAPALAVGPDPLMQAISQVLSRKIELEVITNGFYS